MAPVDANGRTARSASPKRTGGPVQLLQKLSKGLADRPSTIALFLVALVTLGVSSSCFSEAQIARGYSGYMQKMLSAMVTNGGASEGLIKRHASQFPRLLDVPGKEGRKRKVQETQAGTQSQKESVVWNGRRMSLSADDLNLEGDNSRGIGISQIVDTSTNMMEHVAFVANNSSSEEQPALVSSGEVYTASGGSKLALATTKNPTLENSITARTQPTANSTTAEPSSRGTVSNLSAHKPSAAVSNSTAHTPSATANSTAEDPMPHPDFWRSAYYNGRSNATCDLGDGKWLLGPERLPISNCTYASQQSERCAWRFASEPNYREFGWYPNGCKLPHFDAKSFLHQWQNKTIIIAGDSLGRNFYGSFMCKLSAGGPLILNDAETKAAGFQIFRNEEHNITLGRAMSEFLVQKDTSQEAFSKLNQTAGKNRFILQIDKVDQLWAKMLPRADLLILNSGHWWMGGGKEKLYMLDGEYRPNLSWSRAFLIAMKHVRKAVERSSFKGVSIFRTFSPSHYSKGDWNTNGTCDGREPMPQLFLDSYVRRFLDITQQVFANSTFQLMEISRLSAYRSDGHVGPLSSPGTTGGIKADCTHWCAEGVTDAWVDVLQAMLQT